MILGCKGHQQDRVTNMAWNNPLVKRRWGWMAPLVKAVCMAKRKKQKKKMKSHPEWNMTLSVHISLRSLTCCINDTKEADWSLVSVHSPWLHPLKHSYQVTSFQERKTSFHLSDDPQIHLPKLCSAELTRPDPLECRLSIFRNCHPSKKPTPQTRARKPRLSSTGNAVLSPGIF